MPVKNKVRDMLMSEIAAQISQHLQDHGDDIIRKMEENMAIHARSEKRTAFKQKVPLKAVIEPDGNGGYHVEVTLDLCAMSERITTSGHVNGSPDMFDNQ